MTHLIIWLLRVILPADVLSLLVFVGVYTRLAPWWQSPMGITIVAKSTLLALALIPSILSLFLMFNRATSMAAAWVDVVLFGLIAPVMAWRTVAWVKASHDDHGKES